MPPHRHPRKRYPKPAPPVEPATEKKIVHPKDIALRAFGFEIHERKGDNMPRWRLRSSGDVMREDEAVEMMVECRVAGQV